MSEFNRAEWCKRRSAANRKKLKALNQQQTCVVCGTSPPIDLCWHHVNPTTKTEQVSTIMGRAVNWERVQEEIDKCLPMCRECHIALHKAIVLLTPLSLEVLTLANSIRK